MDTVLQHARMYGARDKEDMACTKFFTTEAIYEVLKTINGIDSMMYDYLKAHRTSIQTDDFTSMVIGYDNRIKASAQNKYTPANTKIIKGHQRILPVGFQTGEAVEIENTINSIEELVRSCPGFDNTTDENPFFEMDYEIAVKIINMISSTLRYGDEYENMDYEWDSNEMLTTLDHCTFGTDGKIYCLYRTGRNMSRERDKSKPNKTRWIDAPDDGRTDTAPSRDISQNRPVLMLIKQNGFEDRGWKNTPFFWPVFMVQMNVNAGIFTINGNKKQRVEKKQFKLDTYMNYLQEEILMLSIQRNFLFDIIAGIKKQEYRAIKETTCSLYLLKDDKGQLILVDGTDPNIHYNLSSFNNGIFPFEVKRYKYLYLRSSQDYSGSQALVKLDSIKSYELISEKFSQQDVVYSEHNIGKNAIDDSLCNWTICYNLDFVIEKKLTLQDTDLYKQYIAELEGQK